MVLDTRTQAPAFTLPSRQDGPHFVRVSRISPTGIEGYAGLAEISILARPLPPKLQPQAAEVQVNRDHPLMFAWQTVPDEVALPQRYRLQVAADAGFRTILHDTVVDARSARIQPDTRNRWPAGGGWQPSKAKAAHQKQGPFSAAQRFVLKVEPRSVEPTRPSSGPVMESPSTLAMVTC